MAGEETIGKSTVQLGADGSKLAPEMAAAMAKAQGALDRANKQMERAQASTMKAIQGHIDKINATRPTNEMRMLEQAVGKLGGTAKLNADQLKRVTVEVNALAAAGAKVPASLAGIQTSTTSLGTALKTLMAGGGMSGALGAMVPAGMAAATGIGAIGLAAKATIDELGALLERAGHLGDLSTATKISTTELQRLAYAGKAVGVDLDSIANAAFKLQKTIAENPEKLATLGIDPEKLKGMGAGAQLQMVFEALGRITEQEQYVTAGTDVMGKGFQTVAPMARISLTELGDEAERVGYVLDTKTVAAADRLGDSLDKLGMTWDSFKMRLVAVATGATDSADAVDQLRESIGGLASLLSGPAGSALGALFNVATFGAVKGVINAGKAQAQADFAAYKTGPRYSSMEMPTAADFLKEGPLGLGTPSAEQKAAYAAREAANREAEKSLEKQKTKQQEIADLLQKQLDSARKLAFEIMKAAQEKTPAFTRTLGIETIPQARNLGPGAMVGAKNYDFGIDAQGFITWGDAGKDAAAKAKEAAIETKTWSDSLDSLAQQLNVLANTTGGLTGKLVGFAASLASGLGGAISGFKQMTSGEKGPLAFLGKISGGLGMVGSIVGTVGSLIGGIKSLFGGKSKEQKAAEAAAKKQAEEEKKQAAIQAAEEKKSALLSAKGFAESLMDAISKGGISAKLSTALQAIVGKIGDALLSSGLGILDERLRKSEAYQTTTQLGTDVAGALGAASQAGIYDTGLAAAGGAAAQEIMGQAIADATAAGLTAQEAQKAGFAAVANILREQLNASIRSGTELDANTQALIDEAKANGISILADPAIESLGVQKEQLAVLHQIAGQSGGGDGAPVTAAGGFGPMITPNLGGGFGPRIQTHAGELAMVIPRSRMGPGGLLSAASGLYSDVRGGGRGGWRDWPRTSINLTIAEDPFQTTEGRVQLRRHTLKTVERQTAKKLAALIAAGRA